MAQTVRDPREEALRKGYATIARAYREHLIDELRGKPLDRAMLDAFAEQCPQGTIADVGCGPGQTTRYLQAKGLQIEGLDLSPEMIDQARACSPQCIFRVGDMFALPYADASLAGLVSFYSIVHLQTQQLPFAEFRRALAPRGLLLIAFHAGSEEKHVDELFGEKTSLDFFFHRPPAVTAQLIEAGFTIEARLDRASYPDLEYPSERTYLLARRTA